MPKRIQTNDKINIQEAKESLHRSGYLLENRIESILNDKGFYVSANSIYPDPNTDKARELDIYSFNSYKSGKDEYDQIFSVLLIECINNPQPISFITKEPHAPLSHIWEIHLAGLPLKIPDTENKNLWMSIQEYLGLEKYHHYCTGRISTQYCTFKRKKENNQWMAYHDDVHFNCMEKLCAAIEYYKDDQFENFTDLFGYTPINIDFYYPLIVLQGELYEVIPKGKTINIIEQNHIQFKRAELFKKTEVEYQIDIIKESYFNQYLSIVENEMKKTSRLFVRRYDFIRNSADQILKQIKHLKSKEKIIEELQF